MTAPNFNNNYIIRKTTKADNEGILKISKQTPTTAAFSLLFDRTPNYFKLEEELSLPTHHIIAENKRGEIIGFLHCHGEALISAQGNNEIIYYVGDIKVAPAYRRLGIGKKMYHELALTLDKNGVTSGYGLINAGNRPNYNLAHKMFKEFDLVFKNHQLKSIETHSVYFLNKKTPPHSTDYSYGKISESDLDTLVDLYTKTWGNRFLRPALTVSGLKKLLNADLGLSLNQARVVRKKGQIVAFTLVWDQFKWKKLRVMRYPWALKVMRLLLNILSLFWGQAKLPKEGAPLRYFETAYYTVDQNEPEAHAFFLHHIYNEFQYGGYHFFNIVTQGIKPLEQALKQFKTNKMNTHVLYFHSKEDEVNLDGKEAYIDISLI